MRRINRLSPFLPLASLLLTAALLLSQGAQALDLPMQQADSGNFYIRAQLNGHVETELLLDTGSGYVSLSPATFRRLQEAGGTRFQRRITGIMANGRAVEVPVYRVGELSLAQGCVLRDIEVAVMPGADRDILGLNALERMQPFTFAMEPPMLTGSSCR